MKTDNWAERSKGLKCLNCMWFKVKSNSGIVGRCRKHAPTLDGWPVVYTTDWCGDFKLDENSLNTEKASCE